MFIIANEDIGKVQAVVGRVLSTLSDGAKKVNRDVDIGDGLDSMVVTGYWVVDTIRIDIRIKKQG